MTDILDWFAVSVWHGLALFVFVWLLTVCLSIIITALRK
jgi:hypothetical protein